jgi:hypothetical protein
MKRKEVIWILGSAAVVTAATLGVAACSSDPTTPYAGLDSGKPDTSVNDSSKPDTSTSDSSNPDTSTSDAGCASPPKLFPTKDGGDVFCPFGKTDAGKSEYCKPTTQVCCISPSSDAGSSTCSAPGSCTTGWPSWACSAPSECAGSGVVCCLQAGPLEADPNCSGYQKTKGFTSTTCMASAKCTGTVDAGKFTDTLFIACEQPSDCPQGKTCTAVKTTGTSIGVCL